MAPHINVKIEYDLEIALEASKRAGDIIMKYYKHDYEINEKGYHNPVTTADKEADSFLKNTLLDARPDYGWLSEETIDSSNRLSKKKVWIVDPLDGTKGFLNRTNNFTVNIAYINNWRPELGVIYSPISGELFYTSADFESFKYNFLKKSEKVRLSGNLKNREVLTLITSENNFVGRESKIFKKDFDHEFLKIGSSIKFCKLAEGIADIYPRFGRTMEWDTAAGHAILKYAGGSLLDLKTKKELIYGKKNYENRGFIALRESKDSEKIDWQKLQRYG